MSNKEDTREKLISGLALELAKDDIGIYPQAIIKKGFIFKKKIKRTPWQEGWNACKMSLTKKYCKILDWITKLPEEYRDDIETLLLDERLMLNVGEEVSPWINCNDLFYWACAEGEEISLEEIPELKAALEESPKNGELLWVCRKRSMRPQKPYYKYFTDEEKVLFDACGEERDN